MNALLKSLHCYTQPKLIAIILLGFSSGLPYLLVGGTLGLWLKDVGVEIKILSLFVWASIPYSINFVWAPLVDQLKLPLLTRRMGKRRSWMLLSQLCLLLMLLVIAQIDPTQSLIWFWVAAFVTAFCAATQDIVIDAYRTEYLDSSDYQEGAAAGVFGYRIGVVIAGAGALTLADMPGVSWELVYSIMAALMLIGIVTTLCISEPRHAESAAAIREKGWLRYAMVEPFKAFMQTHKAWPWILLLIFSYRLPDGFIGFISQAFYLDQGFSKTEIAGVVKLFGLVATLVGAVLGAVFMRRYTLHQCLIGFLLFQMLANLGYIGFAQLGASIPYLMLVVSFDNLSAGMITAAAITYMMKLCDLRYTATQYALLSSLASLASKTLAGAAGWVAATYGWTAMFALSGALGLPALIILLSKAISPRAEGSLK